VAVHKTNGCDEMIRQAMEIVGKPMPRLAIAELGCQRIKYDAYTERHATGWTKRVYEFFGVDYLSLDINGRGGCLVHDLSKPPTALVDRFGRYDIVTNFGTSEHVRANQYHCFETMHALCRVDGVLVCNSPNTRHATWLYPLDWYQWLAEACKYKVHRMEQLDKNQFLPEKKRAENPVYYIHAIMQRTANSFFVAPDQWRDPLRWRDVKRKSRRASRQHVESVHVG
jgi:hypothetical protein